jgi:bifunctional non-homologous end joining protein LigD
MKIDVNKHEISISNAEKILFPDVEVSKGDLAQYYLQIAEVMLPHLSGRPISMQRFPNGVDGVSFYQKEIPDYFPEWIQRASVKVLEDNSHQDQVIIENAATLVYLADQACITPHTWLCRKEDLDRPDKLIFDLDPPSGDFSEVREGAFKLREILQSLELDPYVMTTGSRGLHIAIPIQPREDFDKVHEFTAQVAELSALRFPKLFTVEMQKKDRGGKIFVDYLRNSYAQTSVPPYAVRAKRGAPVATPLEWGELKDTSLNSQSYNIKNILRRMGQKDDPWKHFFRHPYHITDKQQESLKDQISRIGGPL